MPTETLAARLLAAPRRWWPELLLAALAGAAFLGCLGTVEIWGKREQRAAAEAIDTIDHNHWLVAQIQGRPRLEKPPLPRWSVAALMILTGRRDEALVRLPGALGGMATVALVYLLGRRIGGRALGLASAFVLCSMGYFVGEIRQASNDGPLVLFTTLALYAAYRRLHDDDQSLDVEDRSQAPADFRWSAAGSGWGLLFHTALGLGFLTKGPVILLLVAVTVVPYLAFAGRLTWGLNRLCSRWGFLIFILLAVSWPAAVLAQDPGALSVWLLEMSEKTGLSRILEHRRHLPLVSQWPGMVLPWTLIAAVSVLLPLLSAKAESRPARAHGWGLRSSGAPRPETIWFAWWWGVGNVAFFCLWAVAKPSYYDPCLPGMALLIGSAWLQLAKMGRGGDRKALTARALLQAQWVLLFVAAVVAPLVVRDWVPARLWPWTLAIGLAVAASVAVSACTWRRGADALPLAPIAAACVFGLVVAYGKIGPAENDQRSHRALAQKLEQLIPPGAGSVRFFNEIDEGLWFYLTGLDLSPVPGTHPHYNTAYDLASNYLTNQQPSQTLSHLELTRQAHDRQALIDWLGQEGDPGSSFLLIRGSLYDRYAADLESHVVPILRESGMKRNDLVLLRVAGRWTPRATAAATAPSRR